MTRPEDESRWLNLRSHYMWEAPPELDEHDLEMPRRRIDYWIRSFIVRESDSERFRSWVCKYKPQDTLSGGHNIIPHLWERCLGHLPTAITG